MTLHHKLSESWAVLTVCQGRGHPGVTLTVAALTLQWASGPPEGRSTQPAQPVPRGCVRGGPENVLF